MNRSQRTPRTTSLFGIILILLMTSAGGRSPAMDPGTTADGRERADAVEPLDMGARSGAAAGESWRESAGAAVRALEYRFTAGPGAEHGAPNRLHGLRSRVDGAGLRVESRQAGADPAVGGWEFALRLTEVGRGDSRLDIGSGVSSSRDRRAEIRRPGLLEWFENREAGLEHGFTLESPPESDAGDEPLVLVLALSGSLAAVAHEDGLGITLRDSRGRPVLRYDGLLVLDARGEEIPAAMTFSGGELVLVVDDAGATYPLTVDPLLTSATTTLTVAQTTARFGFAVAPVGDTNVDGYSDILVGAPLYDGGAVDEGRAFLFLGGPGGLSTSPQWEALVGGTGTKFGWSVAAGGWLDGGRVDLLIGAPGWSDGQAAEGGVFMFSNPATGFAGVDTLLDVDWRAESNEAGAQLGYSLAGAHDVDDDGYDEVVVGAPFYGAADQGAVFVYEGASTGLGANGTPANADWRADGASGDRLGFSVAYAGDVNADGYVDLLAGAPNDNTADGTAHLWLGSSGGLGASGTPTNSDWRVHGQLNEELGRAVSPAGDVNGDGYADVVIGGNQFGSGDGHACVWLGSSSGLSGSGGTSSGADWQAYLGAAYERVGEALSPAGDVNGDGYADLAVGAHGGSGGQAGAFVWYGGPSGLGPTGSAANADWSLILGTNGTGGTGWLQGAGDVNGDGVADLLVGEPLYSIGGGQFSGRVRVFHGSVDGPGTAMDNLFAGVQSGDQFGITLATGDINQDGFGDVVIGAPGYDGGTADEGRVLAFRGATGGPNFAFVWADIANPWPGTSELWGAAVVLHDRNGDGFEDLAIGLPGYSETLADEGAVVYFDGTNVGLSGTVGGDSAWTPGVGGGRFGAFLADAGDVNGDGRADLLVGEPGADAVYLYTARDTGGVPALAWQGPAAAASTAGTALASGDFNGDGYSDFAVGSPGAEFVEVYLSWGGIPGTLANIITLAPGYDLDFGGMLAGGGDVNGDGKDDLLIGAPSFYNAFVDAGRVQLHLGNAGGVNAGWSWFAEGGAGAGRLGAAGSLAGDVNADGFADVLVGEPLHDGTAGADTGRVLLYLGAAGGPAANPAWEVEGTAANRHLGAAVTFGDLDGNGLADPLAGAPGTGTGQVHLYFGGGIPGRGHQARMRQWDGTSYMARHDKTTFDTRVNIVADAFAIHGGRVDMTLRAQARYLPLLFGNPGEEGSDTDFAFPSTLGKRLEATVFNLQAGQFYRWRARIESRSPWFPWGPWLSLEAAGATRVAFRTGGCIDQDLDGYGSPGDPSCAGGAATDNCPTIANFTQFDADGDGQGDACDGDRDGDGVDNGADNCPDASNGNQSDVDGDGEGDVCDVCPTMHNDIDGDGLFGPCAVEAGWSVSRIVTFADGIGAHYNPVDGLVYVARRTGAARGLYRIETSGAATALWTGDDVAGVEFDPDSGDIFTSDDYTGEIFRTSRITGARVVWTSGFHAGDDDPVGLAVAPAGHNGTVLLPGEGVMVDRGANGPDEVWKWDPAVQQAQQVIHADDTTLENPVDVTVSGDKVWIVDTGGPSADGVLYDVQAGGVLVPLVTSESLAEPAAIDIDPADGRLLVLEGGTGGGGQRVVRVDISTGAVSDLIIGLQLTTNEGWNMLDVSPDGARVLVTDREVGRLYEFARDADGDGVGDFQDNCPAVPNPSQQDDDLDGWGDACDCDPADSAIHPGANEYCNGVDDNCDGAIDEDGAIGSITYYPDLDLDSYGAFDGSVFACAPPPGYVEDGTDCDDGDPAINPGALEICANGVDEDCNGTVDDGFDLLTWYEDQDGDGRGNTDRRTDSCAVPPGYVADDSDCDDHNSCTYPGASECNDGEDNQCPGEEGYGQVDEIGALSIYMACSNDGLQQCVPSGFDPVLDCGDPTATCDATTVCWVPQGGAEEYQFATASSADFTAGCSVTTLVGENNVCVFNVPDPAPGGQLFMDVRAVDPVLGPWGIDSSGLPRTVPCAP